MDAADELDGKEEEEEEVIGRGLLGSNERSELCVANGVFKLRVLRLLMSDHDKMRWRLRIN